MLLKPAHQITEWMGRNLWASGRQKQVRGHACQLFPPTYRDKVTSEAPGRPHWADRTGSHSSTGGQGRPGSQFLLCWSSHCFFLPGCRLDLKTVFPGVLSVGHAKVSWSQPLLKKHLWLPITCRNKVGPLNCVWPWGCGFWPHLRLWFGQTHSLHFPNWTLNVHLIWGLSRLLWLAPLQRSPGHL